MGHDIFEGHDGAPLDTPLCGAGPKIEWAGAEHEKNTVERERSPANSYRSLPLDATLTQSSSNYST